MCVVSMIGQWQTEQWRQSPHIGGLLQGDQISRVEFEMLKADVRALRSLLEAAKKFDAATNQPDCEEEEKTALLKAVAKAVGVNLDDVLKTTNPSK